MDNKHPENLLEFPCHYQFKAVGASGEQFKNSIVKAVEKYAVVSLDAVRSRPSGRGNYQAVSVIVTLHNYEQLTDIYKEMKKVSDLKMLL